MEIMVKHTIDDKDFFITGVSITGVQPGSSQAQQGWRVLPQRNLIQWQSGIQESTHSRQLEPRLMRLLCLLAAADGAVLTREALMDELWPHVVVNENSLTRAVSELRKALTTPDLRSSKTSLIETVPKRGYRFNGQTHYGQTHYGQTSVPPASPRDKTKDGATALLRTGPTPKARPALSYPAIAAMLAVTAVMSSLGTLFGIAPDQQTPLLAESAVADPVSRRLEDRVLNQADELPEGLYWLESLHTDALPWLGGETKLGGRGHTVESVVAPGGQMLAYVEQLHDQSQLKLRSLSQADESWTVFSSNQPITRLQWSPLDAGLLFTIEEKDGLARPAHHDADVDDARLARLMLLDLETLEIRELYRRVIPAGENQLKAVGSLT